MNFLPYQPPYVGFEKIENSAAIASCRIFIPEKNFVTHRLATKRTALYSIETLHLLDMLTPEEVLLLRGQVKGSRLLESNDELEARLNDIESLISDYARLLEVLHAKLNLTTDEDEQNPKGSE